MKTHKRLGDYIQEIDVRNRDLSVTTLLGVSVNKEFIPSIANTIGTDMSTYKIIKNRQFVYIADTSRRGDKIAIALLEKHDIAIISQAYTVFEIKDTNKLLPEYLMMWFRRPEFDRYARFHSHGSAREIFDWDEMCDVSLPIPPIERQREIVAEYETLSKRILLNEQMISKLEETAQTLYRKMFVDGIDKENLPEGWRMGKICDICNITSSKRIFESEYCDEGIPFYRGKEISQKRNGEQITDLIYISQSRYQELINNYGKPESGDILLTAVGTIGNSYMVQDEEFYFKDGNIVWFHSFLINGANAYLYEYMQNDIFKNTIAEIAIGSTQKALTIKSLLEIRMVIPNEDIIMEYGKIIKPLYKNIQSKKLENSKLTELQSLLLARIGK